MNAKQRKTLMVALFVMACMTFVPPWVYTVPQARESFNIPAGYWPLIVAPRKGLLLGNIDESFCPRINVERLLFQYLAVILIAAFVLIKYMKTSTEIRQIEVDVPEATDPSNPYGLTDDERKYGSDMIAIAEKVSRTIFDK